MAGTEKTFFKVVVSIFNVVVFEDEKITTKILEFALDPVGDNSKVSVGLSELW